MSGNKRKLKPWEAVALSLGMIGPTLAMSGNAQGLIDSVGAALPMVFILGFASVALIAYGFVRLTRYFNHAGSAYALVAITTGPRTGFFAGFAILGGYLSFSIGTLGAFGAFTNAFLAALKPSLGQTLQIPWIIIALIGAIIAFYFNNRDNRVVARALLIIEGIGIVLMLVLAAYIVASPHSHNTASLSSSFSLHDVGLSSIMGGIVAAFLGWAGFEACATLGEETANPHHNIPIAIFGSVLLTGILFVAMIQIQVTGFGTDQVGLDAFKNSSNSLGSLAQMYMGPLFGVMILFVSMLAAFACHLSAAATASRILLALSRDGFLSISLSKLSPSSQQPRNALLLIATIDIVLNLVSWIFGTPDGSHSAIGSYFYFGIIGSVCLMVAYLMVEVATIAFVKNRSANIPRWELIIPLTGVVIMIVSIYFNLEGGSLFSSAFIALAWCLAGFVIVLAAPRLAKNIGQSFAKEFARKIKE